MNGASKDKVTYTFNTYKSDIEYKAKIKRFLENNNQKLFRCRWNIVRVEVSTNEDLENVQTIITKEDASSKGNIKTIDEDNGRKGYVKEITFELTKSNKIANGYLTKLNRDTYTIE